MPKRGLEKVWISQVQQISFQGRQLQLVAIASIERDKEDRATLSLITRQRSIRAHTKLLYSRRIEPVLRLLAIGNFLVFSHGQHKSKLLCYIDTFTYFGATTAFVAIDGEGFASFLERAGMSTEFGGVLRMTRVPISQAEEHARLLKERLELSTAEIGLQVRTTNCLEEKGIFTVRDLLNSTPETLLSIANFGEKTLEEVYAALERIGYHRPWRKPR